MISEALLRFQRFHSIYVGCFLQIKFSKIPNVSLSPSICFKTLERFFHRVFASKHVNDSFAEYLFQNTWTILSNTQPSFSVIRPCFWSIKREAIICPSVLISRPSVYVLTRPMLSRSYTLFPWSRFHICSYSLCLCE